MCQKLDVVTFSLDVLKQDGGTFKGDTFIPTDGFIPPDKNEAKGSFILLDGRIPLWRLAMALQKAIELEPLVIAVRDIHIEQLYIEAPGTPGKTIPIGPTVGIIVYSEDSVNWKVGSIIRLENLSGVTRDNIKEIPNLRELLIQQKTDQAKRRAEKEKAANAVPRWVKMLFNKIDSIRRRGQ